MSRNTMEIEQLDFEVLLNPSVPEEDELRLSGQAQEMYQIFVAAHKKGCPVSNVQLEKVGFQYQARLWEVRRALIPYGWCIDLVKKGDGGVNYYAPVRLEQSRFFSEHKDKLCVLTRGENG